MDAVLLEHGQRGPRILEALSHPIPRALRADLLRACRAQRHRLDGLWQLDVAVGELFAEAALGLIDGAAVAAGDITAIGSHGQTVRHHPRGPRPYTIQIGDPSIIAERTGITTVADFRRRDIAAGGEGAPLVPAFHEAVFRRTGRHRVVLNIGGIANVTVLSGDPGTATVGFDTGPGNTLMDAWIGARLGQPMDAGARWAESGSVHRGLLETALRDAYFTAPPPKSTGPEHFSLTWLHELLAGLHGPAPAAEDVQRTLVELTVHTIAGGVTEHAPETEEILVCGGGAHNPLLMSGLAARLAPREVASTAAHGIAPDWVEAAAFAWLAKRTLDGLPGNLPAVTGARRPVVLGGVYPGS